MRGGTQVSLLMATILVAVPLAGCVELFVSGTSLRVAPVGDGEVSVTEVVGSGHQQRWEWDGHDSRTTVVANDNHDLIKRTVLGGRVVQDAWLRDTIGVLVYTNVTDQTPEREELADFYSSSVFEQGSRQDLFHEFRMNMLSTSQTCDGSGCTQEERTETYESRSYPREHVDPEWASLAGSVLVPGETRRFDQNATLFGLQFHFWVEYEVLREEAVQGERTMLVVVKADSEIVDPPQKLKEEMENARGPDPKMPLPEPVHLEWYAERAPVPVKSFTSWAFRHEGQVFFSNHTSTLTSYEPGSGPLQWVGPVLPQAPTPADAVAAPKWMDAQTYGEYPLGDAWRAVEDDRALTRYREYRDDHPLEFPVGLDFLPEREDETYWWNFHFGSGQDDGVSVTSRRSPLLPVGDLTKIENQEGAAQPIWFSMVPLAQDVAANLELVPMQAASDLVARLGYNDPTVAGVRMGHYDWDDEPSEQIEARALFADTGPRMEYNVLLSPMYDLRAAQAEQPAAVNLLDGGLESINGDFLVIVILWQGGRLPIPGPLGAHMGDGARHALDAAQHGADPAALLLERFG